jgi:hypothetical protein
VLALGEAALTFKPVRVADEGVGPSVVGEFEPQAAANAMAAIASVIRRVLPGEFTHVGSSSAGRLIYISSNVSGTDDRSVCRFAQVRPLAAVALTVAAAFLQSRTVEVLLPLPVKKWRGLPFWAAFG